MVANKVGAVHSSHASPRSLPTEKEEEKMKEILDPRLLSGRRAAPVGDPEVDVFDYIVDLVKFPKFNLVQQAWLKSHNGKWPVPRVWPWAVALRDEVSFLQPTMSPVIMNVEDPFCNCISAFEHQMIRCPGQNFFATWELLTIIRGKIFPKRTRALQEVFRGFPFVQAEPYENTDYSNPTAWDALHQQPSVLLKWLLIWWENTHKLWDCRNEHTTREQIAQLRGQAFTMASIYNKLVHSENQQKIYGGLFQEEDVKIMRKMIIKIKRLVADIDTKYVEPEEFHPIGHLGHVGPRRHPSSDNQDHTKTIARYDPIAAMMEEIDRRNAAIQNQEEQAIATGDTTEEELSDEEPGADQKGDQKAGTNNGKVELTSNSAIAEETVAARVRGRRRPAM